MESSQDVQQPPASLATLTEQGTQIRSGLQDQGCEENECVFVLVCVHRQRAEADLRFGASVSSELFEELAVSLIPHQGELSYKLR